MTEPLLQATNSTLQNASSGISSGMASSYGMSITAFIIVIVAVVAVFVGSSVRRIQWVHDKLKAFSQTLYYTAVGLGATVVVGVVVAPIYYLSTADGQTQAYVGYAVGGLVGAYVVFTLVGYVVDHVILSTWRDYQETTTDGATHD